ncbi:LVIVD repeat-containing protein [Ancylomarina longa]|uniref:LVIVD repeat-containing protein n=1 Tax=Ancylomarina longa TaxID=2487017 RepID=A0A434ATN7_9BACT|nr:hypothetical protein [Ancylomarina longa]RUT77783.1 hypothetical protein DLK05_11310 [Ancylomarina longa]
MKTSNILFKTLIISIYAFLTYACDDQIKHEYTINEPIYMSKADFKNAVKSEAPKPMQETGKIYFYKDYILVNEKYQGIHVFDNSDPSNPEQTAFITIPGNIDMAVQDDILYADSYSDLLAINISDINTLKEIKQFNNVFYYSLPPTGNNYRLGSIDPEKGVVVGWNVKRISEDYEEPHYYPYLDDLVFSNSENSASGKAISSSTGKAGSMARFMIYANTLYTLNSSNALDIYDISDLKHITKQGNISVNWDIETIFAYKQNLFFGAQSGMYIYDITNPLSPQFISQYPHFRSCDPVVVDNNTAYITLRAGNFCGQNTSQLDVVDLSDITTPTLIKSYQMQNPYGLGVDGDLLFVCDGTGLKIYNKTDPLQIGSNLLSTFTDINPYDVIPLESILVVVSSDGLYQYDYSDINNIQLLSAITIPEN